MSNGNANLPATQAAVPAIDYGNPEMIRTLKATVALGATDAEFAMFAGLAKSTGLNPFKREIWFIKQPGYTRRDGTQVEGKVQIMTGFLGFLAIANSHPQYDGMEYEIERGKDGRPMRAVAKVHRKDRKFPAVAEALWAEDSQPTQGHNGKATIWGKMPSVMLAKVAKSRALREAFPQELGGLYTQEEMPAEYSLEPQRETGDEVDPDGTTRNERDAAAKRVPQPTNSTPRTMPANERVEADLQPENYRLETNGSRKSAMKGKTLAEITGAELEWCERALNQPKRREALSKRDIANIEAFLGSEAYAKIVQASIDKSIRETEGGDPDAWGPEQRAATIEAASAYAPNGREYDQQRIDKDATEQYNEREKLNPHFSRV